MTGTSKHSTRIAAFIIAFMMIISVFPAAGVTAFAQTPESEVVDLTNQESTATNQEDALVSEASAEPTDAERAAEPADSAEPTDSAEPAAPAEEEAASDTAVIAEVPISAASDERAVIASWNYGAAVTVAPKLSANGENDVYAGTSFLSAIVKGVTKDIGAYSSGGLLINGLDGGSTHPSGSYWLIETSTKGMENLQLSFRIRSSSTGPRDFKLQYSTDGSSWTDTGDSYVVGNNVAISLPGAAMSSSFASVQDAIKNQDKLYLRLLLTSDKSARETDNIGSGGANNFNNIELSGTYIIDENQVAAVKADKPSGPVPMNAEVTFSSDTEGAEIFVSDDNGVTFNPLGVDNKYTITSLPMELQAKATKAGLTDSRVTKFSYTQAKLAIVSANPSSGLAQPGTNVTLTAEHGAAITYTLTQRVGETDEAVVGEADATYTQPIQLLEEGFPYKLEAKATLENYIDSTPVSFSYSYKKPDGGEQNYFGQLHSHTTLSDGAGTIDEAYAWARDNAGLDFFAVTDHSNYLDKMPTSDKKGTYNLVDYNATSPDWVKAHQAAETATTADFIGIYGYEMTWSGGPGHMNTFNTTGLVSRNNSTLNGKTNDSGLKAYYELLKETPGSISQFNHPGTTFGNFANFGYYDPVIDERITMVEIGNGEGAVGSGGYFPSYEQYIMALDKGWHVAPTNNQDNHKKGWGTSNTCRSVVWTNDLSLNGVYGAMSDMRMYATEVNDLDIVYTVNGEPLGSSMEVPAKAEFRATVKNPTAGNTVKSVSLVTVGGKEIGQKDFGTQNADYSFDIDAPAPGYYYLKVIDLVGGQQRIAVTAPVWLGKAEAVGITEFVKYSDVPVTKEAINLSASFFNNEDTEATITDIKYYEVGQTEPFAQFAPNAAIAAKGGTYKSDTSITFNEPGEKALTVKATIKVADVSKEYSSTIEFSVHDADKMVYVGIDGSHNNEYVSGNYSNSMNNFAKLAATSGVRTVILNTSQELIAATQNPKYRALILNAPSRRKDNTKPVDEYKASIKTYSDDELDAIVDFAKKGNIISVAGWSDYYENYDAFKTMGITHMSAEQNRVLSALGSKLRLSDDAIVDDVKNGGQSQRLHLTGEDSFNTSNPFLKRLNTQQIYSSYGGSSIYTVDENGNPATTIPASVSPVVFGFPSTYSKDSDADGFGLAAPTDTIPRYGTSADEGKGAGKLLATATEEVTFDNGYTATIIAAGAAYMSDFEIQIEMDNYETLPYANYTFLSNIIESIAEAPVITPINEAKLLPAGTEVTIEGIATSSVNTQAANPATNKGFTDCIYVQDSTGGINLFPVSDGVKEGQLIRLRGKVSSYQGEIQLQVISGSVKVLDSSIKRTAPTVLSTAETMAPANTGLLVKTSGTVSDIIMDGTTVAQFKLDDGSGKSLVYINAYITPGVDLRPIVKEGDSVSVIGLASIGENFADSNMLPRIRVRDRAEIVSLSKQEELQTKYDQHKTKNESDYSTGWAAFATALENAKNILASPVSTEQQIETALAELEAAVAGLVKRAAVTISLNKTSLNLKAGGSETLVATVGPADLANKNVNWTSSNTAVATVDANGKVTAKAAGSSTITATTQTDGKTATCAVVVTKQDDNTVPVSAVKLSATSQNLVKGKTLALTATVEPSNATDKTVQWASSNSAVATVQNGTVTAVGKGTATITASAGGKTASCTITVTVPVSGVKLNKKSVTINVKGSYTLVATVSPADANNKTIKWTTSKSSVATVSSKGVVTGKKAGKATITATIEGKKVTCSVTVKDAVSKVSLSKNTYTLKVNKTYTLKATAEPKNARGTIIGWKTSNPKVATVSTSGKVKAVKKGTATITAQIGNKKATCKIIVK